MGSVTRKKAAASKPGKSKAQSTKGTASKSAATKGTATKAKKTAAKKTAAKAKTAKKSKLSRTPPDLEVDPDVLELISAIDKYKKSHNRPFPSWSEVLYVLRKLGYTKP